MKYHIPLPMQCKVPGCNKIHRHHSGYCADHVQLDERITAKQVGQGVIYQLGVRRAYRDNH